MIVERLFTFYQGKLWPIDTARVTDELDTGDEPYEVNNGVRGAIKGEGVSIEQFTIGGDPVGIPSGVTGREYMQFNHDLFDSRINQLLAQYDGKTVLVVGSNSQNYSRFNDPVFPVVPLRQRRGSLNGDFLDVDRSLFMWDEELGRLGYLDISDKIMKVPHYQLNAQQLVLLEAPRMESGYYGTAAGSSDNSRNTQNFLNYVGSRRLFRDLITGKNEFPLEKIVRVIGDTGGIRGDTCYRMAPITMFGYKSN